MTSDHARLPFRELAEVALTLSAGSHEIELPPRAVSAFGFELAAWGFNGWVEFRHALDASEDPIFEAFVKSDLFRVDLTVAMADRDFLKGRRPPKLRLRGIATERSMEESACEKLDSAPVLARRYRVEFTDPAAALWSQHFPTVLRKEASIAEMVKKLGSVGGIELAVDFDELDPKSLHVCLPLGEGQASFRDYVLWLASSRGGCFTYDYDSCSYRLGKEKPAPKEARAILAEPFIDLDRIRIEFPAVPRHEVRIDNAHVVRHSETLVPNAQAAEGVVRDVVIRTGVSSEVEGLAKREARRVRTPRHELVLPFLRYPDVPFQPGACVKLCGPGTSKRFGEGEDYRVLGLSLEARTAQAGPDGTSSNAPGVFEVHMLGRLECADDPVPRQPSALTPSWPVLVEGKVAVDSGEENDRLYAVVRDDTTAREYTEVTVPIWNERIRVPFQPGFVPGHFYTPLFKGQKVLLALYHERAEIVAFLDWAEGGRLPADGQGNHLLLGRADDAETSIQHRFVDNLPMLSVMRRMDRDSERVELSQGTIVLETKEDEE